MLNNYDKIASHYDFLSRLVFSRAQVTAQVDQLKYIAKGSTILIVGGGTGWILEEIAELHPSGLNITYVEISANMIDISKKRNCKENYVDFIKLAIEDFKTENQFDFILTPFLFDNFSRTRAAMVFNQLHFLLKNRGYWLMVDFTLEGRKGQWWKKIFLKSMYLFFRMFSHVEAKELIDMSTFFSREDYRFVSEQFYYSGFIKATVYQK